MPSHFMGQETEAAEVIPVKPTHATWWGPARTVPRAERCSGLGRMCMMEHFWDMSVLFFFFFNLAAC